MLSEKIKAKANELGYVACGIIPASAFDEYTSELNRRCDLFPESKKYYDDLRDLASLPEDGKSIIVCTQRLNKYKIPKAFEPLYGKMYLFDPRVSYTEEHRINDLFATYIKMLGLNIIEGGVPDRWAGARAGVGKFGRNNFLFDEKHGSFIVIQTWIVDKELDYDAAPENTGMKTCNDGCHKCIEACPTKALSDKLLMNMGKCICRVQFDAEDALSEEMKEQMGLWLYGCDACQDVCPANKNKFTEFEEYPLLLEFEELMKPESIFNMDEKTYKNVLNPRFWYSGEENLWLWKCNALRVMINSRDSRYFDLIKQSTLSSDKRISAVAKWGCEKLSI